MKICIDIKSTLKKPTGIGRYALGLIRNLAALDKENSYYLYCKKSLFSRSKSIPRFKYPNFKIVNDILDKGIAKLLPDMDVFLSPALSFPDIGNAPLIVTVHDLRFKVFPDFYESSFLEMSDNQVKLALKKAKRIICVSENTKTDLLIFYPDYTACDKLEVIYPCVDRLIYNTDKNSSSHNTLKRYGIKGPYILSVCTISKMKNSAVLLKAFERFKKKTALPYKLVLAGGSDKDCSRKMLISNAGIGSKILDDIIFTGYVQDKDLPFIYKEADMFLFPSIYEGFGIPLLEAFSCGIAAITSNTSACKEVAQDAAITVNPENIDELTQAIIDLAENSILRKELSIKALKRADDFKPEKGAKKLLDIFNSIR
jgi:glycosyltransferase involved in cell wall biosynthesis